jgi:tetratricopeptide (TPR) repeat protein
MEFISLLQKRIPNMRSNLLYKGKNYEQALESCEQALAVNPRNDEAHCTKAAVLFQLGRLQEALEASTQALAINPYHIPALINMSTILIKLHRP